MSLQTKHGNRIQTVISVSRCLCSLLLQAATEENFPVGTPVDLPEDTAVGNAVPPTIANDPDFLLVRKFLQQATPSEDTDAHTPDGPIEESRLLE